MVTIKINSILILFGLLSILVMSGCTKTVYVEQDVCPQNCVTSFYEKYGSCRELLEEQSRQGIIIDFEPGKFECDYSYTDGGKCNCQCNCGLGYNFEI